MPGFHTNQTPTPPSARLHSAGSPHQCTGSHDWHHEGSHDLKHRSLGLETPHPSGSLRQKIATSHNGSPCSLLDRGKKPKKWVESTNYRWTCSLFVLFFSFRLACGTSGCGVDGGVVRASASSYHLIALRCLELSFNFLQTAIPLLHWGESC